jgi:catechol 2,3-dioxygenase-like lactoylglutathione lyase family enzyme
MIRPSVDHFRLTTANLPAMVGWYARLFGMVPTHPPATPGTARSDSGLIAAWGSNHQAKPRIAILSLSGQTVERQPRVPQPPRHITFECATLDDLLAAYVRLKGLGIEPTLGVHRGVSTALYYNDPDHNSVELTVDHSTGPARMTDTRSWSAESVARSMGAAVDPEQLLAARVAGMSIDEVHHRAHAGEFLPCSHVAQELSHVPDRGRRPS